ncbi:MAG: condensation domain-containing protein, partial [Acidobacteriota bacterium]
MSSPSQIPSQVPEGLPLSPQQRRLWLLQQESCAYQAQCSILIQGELNRERLKNALNQLVDFHQILRTAFQFTPGFKIPSQVVLDSCPPAWREIDLSGCSGAQQKEQMDSLIRLQRSSPFDLQQGPLVRAVLLILAKQKHLLVLTLPSLCADAWALRTLVREIGNRYQTGIQKEDPGDTLQYAQFSEWQNALLEEEDATEGEVFWRQYDCSQFDGLPLPFESRPKALQKPEMDWLPLPFNPELGWEIESAAVGSGVPAFVFLTACWQALFWRLTGQSEIVVGVASDGREHEMLFETMGLFARWLPLRLSFKSGFRLQDLLTLADQSWREACEWQDYFLPEGDGSEEEAPYFSLGFEALEQPAGRLSDGVNLSLLWHSSCYERFHLKLVCLQGQEGLSFELHYDASRFQRDDLHRLSGQFL